MGLISALTPDYFLLRNPSTLCLIALSILLVLYFYKHIIDEVVRRRLVVVAVMITFWILLRGAKYIAFEESGIVARHIWYLYYVPVLMIPLFSLYVALGVGERKKPLPLWIHLVDAWVLLLCVLVLTNDRHRMVFQFLPGFENWDAKYSRGWVFAAIYLTVCLMAVAILVILFYNCRLMTSRKMIWIPMLPIAFGVLYLFLYATDKWVRIRGSLVGEFPEAVCFTVAGMWLSLIRIGLIPSNEGYGKLFEASNIAAQITDRDHRVIYRSAGAKILTQEQLRRQDTFFLDEHTRIHHNKIRGGYVYWQDDVGELNRILEELEEVGERLAEETELIRLQNELRQRRAQIAAQSKLYDTIAGKVNPQTRQIAALAGKPVQTAEDLYRICLLGTYIKRYANLTLLASETDRIEAGELQLAVAETLRQLESRGIAVHVECMVKKVFSAKEVLRAYALLEEALEQSSLRLQGVQVVILEKCMKVVLEGCEVQFSLPDEEEGRVESSVEDHVTYLKIRISEGGEL